MEVGSSLAKCKKGRKIQAYPVPPSPQITAWPSVASFPSTSEIRLGRLKPGALRTGTRKLSILICIFVRAENHLAMWGAKRGAEEGSHKWSSLKQKLKKSKEIELWAHRDYHGLVGFCLKRRIRQLWLIFSFSSSAQTSERFSRLA